MVFGTARADVDFNARERWDKREHEYAITCSAASEEDFPPSLLKAGNILSKRARACTLQMQRATEPEMLLSDCN